jgi:5,10-methenyltetrahydrofolate synthetase
VALSPELAAWRKGQRETLLQARQAVPAAMRAAWSASINGWLDAGLGHLRGDVVLGLCWPFKAEFDARHFAARIRRCGVQTALPVVRGAGQGLEFRIWSPGTALERGVYGIPFPRDSASVLPDLLLVPPVGMDAQGFRLGYGGGYFDRTLAAQHPRPLCVALGFEISRIPNIHPQAHDIGMDALVTERSLQIKGHAGLETVDPARFRQQLQMLKETRANMSGQGRVAGA